MQRAGISRAKRDWEVTYIETFGGTEVFSVRDKNDRSNTPLLNIAHIWWAQGRARCTKCNSLMRGMSASCEHARAAKRIITARKEIRPIAKS